jgi:hypothetical protein
VRNEERFRDSKLVPVNRTEVVSINCFFTRCCCSPATFLQRIMFLATLSVQMIHSKTRSDTQDDVDEQVAGKGRKRALDSFDSDDEGVHADTSKRPRLVPLAYESDDADIEMTDGVAA